MVKEKVQSKVSEATKHYIEDLVVALGNPWTESSVVCKFLEFAIERHKRGEFEIP